MRVAHHSFERDDGNRMREVSSAEGKIRDHARLQLVLRILDRDFNGVHAAFGIRGRRNRRDATRELLRKRVGRITICWPSLTRPIDDVGNAEDNFDGTGVSDGKAVGRRTDQAADVDAAFDDPAIERRTQRTVIKGDLRFADLRLR